MNHPRFGSPTRHAAFALSLGALALSGCVSQPQVTQASASGGSAASTCPVAPDKSVTSTVKIGFQKIANGDLVVKDQKMLETCLPQAKIVWTEFPSGGAVLQGFGSGSANIALLGSSPATKGLSAPLNAQMDIKVVWIQDVIGKAETLVAKKYFSHVDQGPQGQEHRGAVRLDEPLQLIAGPR